MRQYNREDIDYDTWYSEWMKQLARNYTKEELERRYYGATKDITRAVASHLNAVERTHSMTSNSQRRAQSRNVVAATGEYKIALSGALEIYDLFPEHTKEHSPRA